MSDVIWETFDSLFKIVHRQGRRVEELEARVVELERRLQGRTESTPADDNHLLELTLEKSDIPQEG